MLPSLPRSAQIVQEALNQKGFSCAVVQLSADVRTAAAAAEALGCEVAQIAKSLIFKTHDTHKPVLILASGVNRVNEKQIEAHVGEKIVKADAEFTRAMTGFAIGGIPPVGHQKKIEFIFIDKDLLKLSSIWAAAGTPDTVFNCKGEDLTQMTDGTVIAVN